MYEYISVNRHELSVGKLPGPLLKEHPDALSIMAVGQPIPYSFVRIADDTDQEVAEGHVGHVLISGDNVTRGYFENPEANAKGFTAPDAHGVQWLRTGDMGMMKGGKLYITGRAKEIIFVNGQNYYPHDIESVAIRAENMELGKVVAAGVRAKGASTDDLILFVLHRMDMKEFLPITSMLTRLVNEHTGLEVAHVVPVKRIPKTTSGKIQRHLLEEDYVNGVYAAELAELDGLRAQLEAAGGAKLTSTEIERRIKDICDAALERNIDVNDNLFEIGASSLKLIEIHEQMDKVYPGMVDLTELFDFPTIGELSRHLEAKLAATV
jgi:aryl carrier-like protein